VPPPQTPTAARHNSADEERAAGQTTPGPNSPSQRIALDGVPCQPLTLAEAIALAFRLQPRLRSSLESIEQARGREDIAFAAFLPTLTSDYSVGGFDLNVGGGGSPVPNLPAFSFIPFTGAVPSGLKIRRARRAVPASAARRWAGCGPSWRRSAGCWSESRRRTAGSSPAGLQRWLRDPYFAGVREADALSRLPVAERQAWQMLWADVADTVARAEGTTSPEQ
jgi:hypothetical protein